MSDDDQTRVLVLPDQLFERHPLLSSGPRRAAFLEHRWYYFGQRYGRQRLALFRAAGQAYCDELRRAGHDVNVFGIDEGSHLRVFQELAGEGVRHIEMAEPADRPVLPRLRREARRAGIAITTVPNPNFLTPRDVLAEHLVSSGGHYAMAPFYRHQRRRLGVLVEDDGRPVGGTWSFDARNRRRLPRDLVPPEVWSAPQTPWSREAAEWVARTFPNAPGADAGALGFPVTRTHARRAFDDFLEHRLASFGDFEDAISSEHAVLFHSVATPALNIGLLDPGELVQRALDRAEEGDVPLNSLEGFVRQVIGWREYMRGVYLAEGRRLREANELRLTREMPASFYDATTGLLPLDATIERVTRNGWVHHIERLMVLGNAMLLADIAPDAVYRWFMELFVDSADWVMVPNVYGMSQYADLGSLTTKPYVSGSNYLRKMGDYEKGPWCDVWDGLFWRFVRKRRAMLASNPRTAVLVRTLDRTDPRRIRAVIGEAESWLRGLA